MFEVLTAALIGQSSRQQRLSMQPGVHVAVAVNDHVNVMI